MKKYIYGLDLSLSNTGIAIFDNETGELVKVCSVSTAITKKTGLRNNPNINNKDMITGIKLHHIYTYLGRLREEYPPAKIIIERGFTRFNKATQILFRVHGIINLLFYDVENIYYSPTTIKEVISNHGQAKKKDLGKLIVDKLGYSFENEDESDAIAIGLTYLIEEKIIEWK